jgi:phosphoglycolate phosphatase
MQRYHTILFDFDGTLADSEEVMRDAINSLAPEFGFAPIAKEEAPVLKTLPLPRFVRERLGVPLWNIPKLLRLERRGKEEFARRSDRVRFFPGMSELVHKLYAAGYEIGIVTSSDTEVVRKVLERDGASVHFIHAGSRIARKAGAIRAALAEFDLRRDKTLYVGDELRDVRACKKAGIDFVGVGWGLNAPEALRASGAPVASTPQELLAMLTQ